MGNISSNTARSAIVQDYQKQLKSGNPINIDLSNDKEVSAQEFQNLYQNIIKGNTPVNLNFSDSDVSPIQMAYVSNLLEKNLVSSLNISRVELEPNMLDFLKLGIFKGSGLQNLITDGCQGIGTEELDAITNKITGKITQIPEEVEKSIDQWELQRNNTIEQTYKLTSASAARINNQTTQNILS